MEKIIRIRSCRSNCPYCKDNNEVLLLCTKINKRLQLHSSSPFPMECPLENYKK